VQALHLLGSQYATLRKAHKAADTNSTFSTVLPRLLAACGSAHRSVRAAALTALPLLAEALKATSSRGALPPQHLSALVAATQQQRHVLEADAGALSSALCLAVQHAAAGAAVVRANRRRGKKDQLGNSRSFSCSCMSWFLLAISRTTKHFPPRDRSSFTQYK
jgi:hypothetical protein